MKDLETELSREGKQMSTVEIPPAEEMEARLRGALATRRRRRFPTGLVAAGVVFALLFTYSFDSIAYYGKKFIGYDEVVTGSLKELNEEGRGQEINETRTFSNGVEFTWGGLMFDDNELVIFYKLHSTGKKLDFVHLSTFFRLEGLKPMGYPQRSGHGMLLDENTAVYTQTFEAPQFYEKWMSLTVGVRQNQQAEEKKLSFTLDRSKALKVTIKQQLEDTAVIGDYQIHFESLSATAMGTVMEGSITSEAEEAMKRFLPDDSPKPMQTPFLKFDLVTDKGEVNSFFTESMSTSGKDVQFRCSSEALPKEFSTLTMENIRLENNQIVDAHGEVDLKTKDLQIAEDVAVKKVYRQGEETVLVIASKGIPVMGLFQGDRQLEQLEPDQYERTEAAETAVERTYRFKGTGEGLRLEIKLIRYVQAGKSTLPIYGY